MVSKAVGKDAKKAQIQAPEYTIQMQDSSSDLTVEIDDTNFLYGAKFALYRVNMDDDVADSSSLS